MGRISPKASYKKQRQVINSHGRINVRHVSTTKEGRRTIRRPVAAIGLEQPIQVLECRLSVVDQTGETDVFALFEIDGQKGVLLIENKIDASFMPRQPERYRERAGSLVAEGSLDLAFCVLVAPKAYANLSGASIKHFDAVIAYEDIAGGIKWVDRARKLSRRTPIACG